MAFVSSHSEDRQRLLKGVAISLIFHTLLILILGGVSLAFSEPAPERMGPLSLSIEPFDLPSDETLPAEEAVSDEEVLPEEEVLPIEEEPLPESEVLPEPEDLPEPEPLPEIEPEPVPDAEAEIDAVAEVPEASPGLIPAAEDSPAPQDAAPSSAPEPAASEADRYQGRTEVSDAYKDLFSSEAATREAEDGTGGRSGETVTDPDTEIAPSGSSRAGIYSQENRTVSQSAANTGSRSDSREAGDEGLVSEVPDLGELDAALAGISEGTEGVYIVDNSSDGLRASVPGNLGDNTSQISFLEGEGRRLVYSEPPEIPASVKSVGLPKYIITVYFTVTPDGAVKDLNIDPPSGNFDLDTAIKQSVRNWLFNSSGDSGTVKARVQFLIKVK